MKFFLEKLLSKATKNLAGAKISIRIFRDAYKPCFF